MKIIIQGSTVIATHSNSQDVAHLYPGCLILTVPDGTPVEIGQTWEVTVEQAKTAGIEQATALCDAVLAPLGREYGAYEMATWDQQYSEALAYKADPTADVPLLASMCVARGVSIATLADRVVANRNAWVALTGNVIGQRQRIVDQISAAETVEAVMAVDMTITLPG